MSFILAAQRQPETVVSAFEKYYEYVAAHAGDFPSGAFALASSDWYFDFNDHRCPHDAWFESLTVSEPSSGDQNDQRRTEITLKLLGAYHDRFITFQYSEVIGYSISAPSSAKRGLGDWGYDEFRLHPDGHLIHEIEWAGFPHEEESRWLIECSDIHFDWLPVEPAEKNRMRRI